MEVVILVVIIVKFHPTLKQSKHAPPAARFSARRHSEPEPRKNRPRPESGGGEYPAHEPP